MFDDILSNADNKMGKVVEALKWDLASIRTGRASPTILDSIKVDYHGVPTPINQMATVSTPEARLLVVQPWDKSVIGNIEKAILKSDLGLNPANDGNVIRLPIPALTEERRKEMVKMVGKKGEERKVMVRNIRREAIDKLKKMEKDKEISQDERTRASDRLQKITDDYIAGIDKAGQEKEKQLIEI